MADADETLAYSAAEFFLRRRDLPASVAISIVHSLPPTSCSSLIPPSLRRIIFIRHLFSCRTISFKTLQSIEQLYYLNPNPNPNPNSNSLASTAYLAVAVHMAVTAQDFPTAVDILFNQRVGDIIRSPEAAGLVSPMMKEVAEEMKKAVTDLELRERILNNDTMDDVEEAIGIFVDKEWKEIVKELFFVDKEWEEIVKEPFFLDIAAELANGVPGAEAWMEAVEKEWSRLQRFKRRKI